MRTKSVFAVGAIALVAVGVFAGVSLAGSSKGPSQARVVVPKPVTAVATRPGESRSATASKPKGKSKKPTIQYFFASTKTVPDEGSGALVALRCPKGKGEPIGGGADTQEGIVISYLSRISPTGTSPARTYYIGVDDNSDDPAQAGSGAFAEIECATNISVKHP